LFDQVFPKLVELARRHGLAKNQAGDWFDPDEGRTLYIGGKGAARRVRMYEKGKKLLTEGGLAQHPDADPNHVRFELQYRPEHAEQKAWCAKLDPGQLFGTSPWVRDALEVFCGVEADPVSLRRYRPPDVARARYWMLKQYGGVIAQWADECGGYEHLGINIEYGLRDLADLERGRAAQRHQRRAA
jgi:hypothetical protein